MDVSVAEGEAADWLGFLKLCFSDFFFSDLLFVLHVYYICTCFVIYTLEFITSGIHAQIRVFFEYIRSIVNKLDHNY